MKKFIWLGLFLGGIIGGFIPSLWSAGYFSLSGVLFSTIGGIIGVWLGFKTEQYFSS